jgi:hypothetical protein
MNHRQLGGAVLLCLAAASVNAANMFSTHDSFMGAGEFFGPGKLPKVPIFDVHITNIVFPSAGTFVTPFINNGAGEPNTCGDRQVHGTPTGLLSDGKTPLNENLNACAFELNGMKILVGVTQGGEHLGQQLSVALEGGSMIMTMDFALDLGVGESGVIKLPFYGTTEEVTVPHSLQTQMGLPGGIDQAGALKPGEKLRGRLGDFNHDGLLDGAIVVAGNIPLSSIFMPGAPYALIRYFETDVPYDGHVIGRLPRPATLSSAEPPKVTIIEPAAADVRTAGSLKE